MEDPTKYRKSVQEQSIKDILTTWRAPRDLFGPLSKFVRRNINDLEILLELFPNKRWDLEDLSRNPNIT